MAHRSTPASNMAAIGSRRASGWIWSTRRSARANSRLAARGEGRSLINSLRNAVSSTSSHDVGLYRRGGEPTAYSPPCLVAASRRYRET